MVKIFRPWHEKRPYQKLLYEGETALRVLKDLLRKVVSPIGGSPNYGETAAQSVGMKAKTVGSISSDHTKAEDTIAIAKSMVKCGGRTLMFAGGDGTARNIYEAVGTL